ncbi:hypothetical protein [Thalassomonas sp. M1454]|uniref:hypothetical protein n=1 Tax=Thalassomonas sp. M1454 TaxID=2594477 RepID=UPI00117F4C27|nr:hypothetical protein [Thalassomonas sp. M1454]TRX55140.1 hypothetical protein FNN08_11140 [Thalassomonas sp. M1454]
MSSKQQQQSRKTLVLVLLAFILPILLAKLALDNQWFNYGVTNQGDLIENPLTLNEVGIDPLANKQWLVIYNLPDDCQQQCLLTLKGIENSYLALGRETPRVTPIAISNSPFNAEQLKLVNQQHWKIISTPADTSKTLSTKFIYVADPLGNIVLSYPEPTTEAAIPEFGKAMLADLKKVLKYSRIG